MMVHTWACQPIGRLCTASPPPGSTSLWVLCPVLCSLSWAILQYFTSYMEHLMKGGDLPSVEDLEEPVPPFLLEWVKTGKALLMLFSDGIVQVNFYGDPTKLSLSGWGPLFVTFVARNRSTCT